MTVNYSELTKHTQHDVTDVDRTGHTQQNTTSMTVNYSELTMHTQQNMVSLIVMDTEHTQQNMTSLIVIGHRTQSRT